MNDHPNRRTWLQRVFDGWGHWFHFIYALIAVTGLLVAGATEAHDVKVTIAYVGLLIYIVILLALLGYFIISYSRKARYSEAMYSIHSAIHEIRNAHAYLDDCRKSQGMGYESARFKEMLRGVLDHVVQAFDIVSAVQNRACVHVLDGKPNNEVAPPLCRDDASHLRLRDEDAKGDIVYTLDRNTDFHLIVKGEQRYFHSDNLAKYPDYMSTSLSTNGRQAGDSRPSGSRLVLPIRFAKNSSGSAEQRITFLGLLVIDAHVQGAYSKPLDIEMGAIVADSLFPLLELWNVVDKTSAEGRARAAAS